MPTAFANTQKCHQNKEKGFRGITGATKNQHLVSQK